MAALIAAITCAIFSRVLGAEFVRWDDDIQIVNNARLGPLNWETVKWAFRDFETGARYIPLTLIGESAGISLAGKSPATFHLGNLLLHAASAALVFLALRRLLLLTRTSKSTGNGETALVLCAAIGAAFWAWHPLRVEPVAWATTRTYCQCLFLLLLSLLCYLNAQARSGTNERRDRVHYGWYGCSLLAFAASLLSYPAALAFVVVVATIDVYVLHRSLRDQRVLLEKVPFMLLGIGAVVLALAARLHSSMVFPDTASLAEFGVAQRLAQASYIWTYFAWRPLVPIGISPIYTTLVTVVPGDPRFVLSGIGVIVLTVFLLVKRKRWPGALALWICHLAMLVPMLGLMEHPHYPSDRYSLVVGVVWAMAVAGVLWSLASDRSQRGRFVATVAIVSTATVALGAMSYRQTAVWKDSQSLFTFMLERLGDDPYRGDILMRRAFDSYGLGDVAGAESDLRAWITLDPNSAMARSLLSQVLGAGGRWEEATVEAREVARLRPDDSGSWNMLALNLVRSGRGPEATVVLTDALERFPESNDIRFNLGAALLNGGRPKEAAAIFEAVLAREPGHPDAPQALKEARSRPTPASGAGQ